MKRKSFTTVTPFSKTLALIIFTTFPILGFFFGIYYERSMHEASTTTPSTTFLFVEQAKSGTIKQVAGEWTLTLIRPSRRLTYFTDRPNRTFGEIEFGAFLSQWDNFGFTTANPPNAAITVDPALSKVQNPSVMLVTLENPTYDTDTDIATFKVRPLQKPSQGLQSFTAQSGELTESTLFEPSLFIDNATVPPDIRFFTFGMPLTPHDFHIHMKGNVVDRRKL